VKRTRIWIDICKDLSTLSRHARFFNIDTGELNEDIVVCERLKGCESPKKKRHDTGEQIFWGIKGSKKTHQNVFKRSNCDPPENPEISQCTRIRESKQIW
jgi:hypothetical protein